LAAEAARTAVAARARRAAATTGAARAAVGAARLALLGLNAVLTLGALLAVFFKQRAARGVDAAPGLDARDHDHDLVAELHHVLNRAHAVVRELGDVHHRILAGQDLDEGAEGQDAHDLAGVDLAALDLLGEALDHLDRLARALFGRRADEHRAVVLDVHR